MSEKKPDKSNRSLPLTQRRALLIPLALGIVLLQALVFSQQAFNLKQLADSPPGRRWGWWRFPRWSSCCWWCSPSSCFATCWGFAERRLGVLGSRFRTRMLLGALVLSFAPAIVMFMFAYGLINRLIDKWFSSPVNALHQGSGEAWPRLLTASQGDSARHTAMDVAELFPGDPARV